MDTNIAVLQGNLTKNAELLYAPNGTAIGKFTIAVNRKIKEKEETLFMDCTIFGKYAESMVKYLSKGRKITVNGYLRQENWVDNNGNKRSKIVLIVDNIAFCSSNNNSNSENSQNSTSNTQESSTDYNSINIDEEDIPF